MIEMCGKIEVKKTIFEAVKVETHESLEFLKVSHPVNYLQYNYGLLMMITSIKIPQ